MTDIAENRRIITSYSGRSIRIMEVCGTHTHEIFALGIRSLLPPNIRLISGPGCPVCVTPVSFIDEAVMLAMIKGCIITTFGDLMRVPGSDREDARGQSERAMPKSLLMARAAGAKVEVVYSPLDAADYAAAHKDSEVVFLSVGFETTTPASCLAVRRAFEHGVKNFSILTANKTMDNVYTALRGSADAFLYPGHVSVMTGCGIYEKLCNEGISGAVAGFTAEEILEAIATIVTEASKCDENGAYKPFFKNCYTRVVSEAGNKKAMDLVNKMMTNIDTEWRGLGVIPNSGLKLRDEWASYDARRKFNLPRLEGKPNKACRCSDVLMGNIAPYECPLFGKACTPNAPVGACMVSSEGACAAFYKYGL